MEFSLHYCQRNRHFKILHNFDFTAKIYFRPSQSCSEIFLTSLNNWKFCLSQFCLLSPLLTFRPVNWVNDGQTWCIWMMVTWGQFHQHFTSTDPKSAKKTDCLTVFFALLGSARIKAAHKKLVKSTPCVSEIWTTWYFCFRLNDRAASKIVACIKKWSKETQK